MMKKLKLRILLISLLVIASITVLSPVGASASEWKQDSIGWKWYKDDGNYAIGWQQIEGNWYYFYYGGYMAHDTIIDDDSGKHYWLSSNGVMEEGIKGHLNELSKRYSKGVTAETAADLNRKLSSGITLREAIQKLEDTSKEMAKLNTPLDIIQNKLNEMMKEFGTSSRELLYVLYTNTNPAWQQDSNGWWYKEGDSFARGWRFIDNNWYYFYANGYMAYDAVIVDTNDTYSHLISNGQMKQSATLSSRQSLENFYSANGGHYSFTGHFMIEPTWVNTIDEWNKANNTSTNASTKKTDTSKVLSSGMTLKEAKLKIDSAIAGIKVLGETVEENMDYINQLCKSMGTTYDEVKSFQLGANDEANNKNYQDAFKN